MKWFDNTALTLVIIGALNWLQNYLYHYRSMWTLSHQPLWKNRKFILKKGYPYYGCPFYIFTYYFSGIASTIAVISL